MKTLIPFLLAFTILTNTVARAAFREPALTNPSANRSLFMPDSNEKRLPPMFPGKPRPRPPEISKPKLPLGTLKVTTEVPSMLFFDGDTAAKMTRYHLVTIYSVPVGTHEMTFRNKSFESTKTIEVDSGTTGYYRLRIDSTISDSVTTGKLDLGHKRKIVSQYVPFKHAVSFELLPGFFFNGRGIGYNVRFVGSYNINRILKLGLGSGYASYPTHIKQRTWEWFEPAGAYESESFNVSFVPVYINSTINFLDNRTTTFLSFDLGLSIPLTQSVSCKSTYSGSSDYFANGSTYYLQIDRIKTGFYMGLALGMKYFFSPVFEGGIFIGLNGSFNDCTGNYYLDPDHEQYYMEFRNPHMTFGFGLGLTFGFNLATKK